MHCDELTKDRQAHADMRTAELRAGLSYPAILTPAERERRMIIYRKQLVDLDRQIERGNS